MFVKRCGLVCQKVRTICPKGAHLLGKWCAPFFYTVLTSGRPCAFESRRWLANLSFLELFLGMPTAVLPTKKTPRVFQTRGVFASCIGGVLGGISRVVGRRHLVGARRRRMMATKNTKRCLAASSPCVSNHLHMRPTQGEEARKEPHTFAPPVAAPSRPYEMSSPDYSTNPP